MSAARLLRTARHQAGISQAELARRAGTTRSIVNAYERGTREPGVEALERLLAAAGFHLALAPRPPIDEERSAAEFADVLGLAAALPRASRHP